MYTVTAGDAPSLADADPRYTWKLPIATDAQALIVNDRQRFISESRRGTCRRSYRNHLVISIMILLL
eukprot:6197294-Pleurochrysis_carterae.AAC.3